MTVMAVMIAMTLWLGLYPRPFLDTARGGLANLGKMAGTAPREFVRITDPGGGTHDTP